MYALAVRVDWVWIKHTVTATCSMVRTGSYIQMDPMLLSCFCEYSSSSPLSHTFLKFSFTRNHSCFMMWLSRISLYTLPILLLLFRHSCPQPGFLPPSLPPPSPKCPTFLHLYWKCCIRTEEWANDNSLLSDNRSLLAWYNSLNGQVCGNARTVYLYSLQRHYLWIFLIRKLATSRAELVILDQTMLVCSPICTYRVTLTLYHVFSSMVTSEVTVSRLLPSVSYTVTLTCRLSMDKLKVAWTERNHANCYLSAVH